MKKTTPQTYSWLLMSVNASLGFGRSPRQRSWAKARSWTRPRWSPTCLGSTSCSAGRPYLPQVVDFLLLHCPVSFTTWQYLTGPFRWESLVQINLIFLKKAKEKHLMNWRNSAFDDFWASSAPPYLNPLLPLRHAAEWSMSYLCTDSAFGCFNLYMSQMGWLFYMATMKTSVCLSVVQVPEEQMKTMKIIYQKKSEVIIFSTLHQRGKEYPR